MNGEKKTPRKLENMEYHSFHSEKHQQLTVLVSTRQFLVPVRYDATSLGLLKLCATKEYHSG